MEIAVAITVEATTITLATMLVLAKENIMFVKNRLGKAFLPLGQEIIQDIAINGITVAHKGDIMDKGLKTLLINKALLTAVKAVAGAIIIWTSIAFFLAVL